MYEYKRTGWIPVKEKMPEEKYSIFAKYKGTLRWSDSMFENISDRCLITINANNQPVVDLAHTCDGEWKANLLRIFPEAEVTAWMPIPEPYRDE